MSNQIKLTDAEKIEYLYHDLDLDKWSLDKSKSPIYQLKDDDVISLLQLIRNLDYLPFTLKHIFNLETYPLQLLIIRQLFKFVSPLLLGSRGLSKSFSLAVYIMLRLLLDPGIKIVVVGAAFRQSKHIFFYCEKIWNNAPVLRSICGTDGKSGCFRGTDRFTVRVGESECAFLPLGDGETIRGERSNITIVDEFDSIALEVFEVVVKGFSSVSSNPIESMRYQARTKKLKGKKNTNNNSTFSNQTVIAGTAKYTFGPFFKYFDRYKKIIESRGDERVLENLMPDGMPPGFDWKDYCIIRIPYELIPDGFLDEKQVGSAKATSGIDRFNSEYGCVFISDTNGFFKRTLIESCTVKDQMVIGNSTIFPFTPMLFGEPHKKYVMGIDPASEKDNFSITILEVCENYRKVVYCWTTNRTRLKEKIQHKIETDQDYYSYCARKIRDLMKSFNIEYISIDTQGGGIAIIEALRNKAVMEPGELPLYPVIEGHFLWDGTKREEDMMPGLHIIHLAIFARADFVSEINHGLRLDMENKVILFPNFDSVELAKIDLKREENTVFYDGVEDCMFEIEELKDELTSIVHTQTGTSMRDRWDTPEVKLAENKKGRLRKDRYSSLIIANGVARKMNYEPYIVPYQVVGGFAKQNNKSSTGDLYYAPDNLSKLINQGMCGTSVRRGV